MGTGRPELAGGRRGWLLLALAVLVAAAALGYLLGAAGWLSRWCGGLAGVDFFCVAFAEEASDEHRRRKKQEKHDGSRD